MTDDSNKKLANLAKFVATGIRNLVSEIKPIIENSSLVDIKWGASEGQNVIWPSIWIENDDENEDEDEREILTFDGIGKYTEIPDLEASMVLDELRWLSERGDGVVVLPDEFPEGSPYDKLVSGTDDLVRQQGELTDDLDGMFRISGRVWKKKDADQSTIRYDLINIRVNLIVNREAIKKHNEAEELDRLIHEISSKIKPFIRIYSKMLLSFQ